MSTQPPATDGEDTQTTDDPLPESVSIAKDDAFHILQNARRRAVLRYLLDHADKDEFRMRTVTEEVAAWEHDTTVEQLTSAQRQRVYIALYQSHLPKLNDHGIIEYDQNRGTFELNPLIHALAPYLAEGLHIDNDDVTVSEDKTPDRSWSDTVSIIFSR